MIKHTYLRYLLLIACFAPCASFATGTQTNCIQAVEQALRDEFERFDQEIFDREGIDEIIQHKMNTTLKNVMETADDCQDNTAKKYVDGHYINIDLKNHTFTFRIKVTESNGNNGGDGDDSDNDNEEEHVYDDQTPTGYTSKYYLMFDKTTYENTYGTNITEIKEFQQATLYSYQWPESCSQHEVYNHNIKNNATINVKLRNNQTQIFGGQPNNKYEYYLNLPGIEQADLPFPYYTAGILFIAPSNNRLERQPVTHPFTHIEKTREIRKKIAQQLKSTSCKGLKIYILEERTNNSDNTKKIYIHPNPITIE